MISAKELQDKTSPAQALEFYTECALKRIEERLLFVCAADSDISKRKTHALDFGIVLGSETWGISFGLGLRIITNVVVQLKKLGYKACVGSEPSLNSIADRPYTDAALVLHVSWVGIVEERCVARSVAPWDVLEEAKWMTEQVNDKKLHEAVDTATKVVQNASRSSVSAASTAEKKKPSEA